MKEDPLHKSAVEPVEVGLEYVQGKGSTWIVRESDAQFSVSRDFLHIATITSLLGAYGVAHIGEDEVCCGLFTFISMETMKNFWYQDKDERYVSHGSRVEATENGLLTDEYFLRPFYIVDDLSSPTPKECFRETQRSYSITTLYFTTTFNVVIKDPKAGN